MSINPRRVARDILVKLDRGPLDLQRAIADAFPDGASSRDRALASELVWGVARWRYRLDALLRKATGRRVKELDRSARALLRMGLYQLEYLDRVPASAAVNETVCLAGNNRRLKGFINGVLRRCAEQMPTLDDGGAPARLLGQSASLPPWLAERWWQRYGEAGATARAHQANTPARLTLRLNTAACSMDDYLSRLAGMGLEAHASQRVAGAVCLSRFYPVTELPGYDDGWIYVQDEASQWVGQLLAAQPGERVLDACAAPGGKTTQLSAAVGPDGQVVAVEIDPARIPRLQENLTRLHADNVHLVTGDLATLSAAGLCPAQAGAWRGSDSHAGQPQYGPHVYCQPADRRPARPVLHPPAH